MARKKREKCPVCERLHKLIKLKICNMCSYDIDLDGEHRCQKCPIVNPCPACGGKGYRDWVDEMRRPMVRVEIAI